MGARGAVSSAASPVTRATRLFYLLIYLLLEAAHGLAYNAIGAWAALRPSHTLATFIDGFVPFVPAFHYVYLLAYLMPGLAALLIQSRERFRESAIGFVLMNLIAFPIYLLYPVRSPRPSLRPDSVTTWLLALEYRLDTPVNCMPSFHVGVAWLFFYVCRTGRRRALDAALLALALGITVSTLFVKQHWAVDLPAGWLLAFVSLLAARALVTYARASGDAARATPRAGRPR
jgi:membrane-associated phospholipid phosphatase